MKKSKVMTGIAIALAIACGGCSAGTGTSAEVTAGTTVDVAVSTADTEPAETSEAAVSNGSTDEADSIELVSERMEWRYLDTLETDPNAGTWYEGWNKRNGWVYPIGWLDWGTEDMVFDDADWPVAAGTVFSTDETEEGAIVLPTRDDGTAGPTYFLRYTFELDNPEEVKSISGKVRYNDAVIIYLNGKPIDSLFNIPVSNYSKNLEYGASEPVNDKYVEEEFVMEDVTSLLDGWEGRHTIGVELHCAREGDQDAYFELVSLQLNPPKEILPETEEVKNIAVNVGENENSVNFTWFALSDTPGELQIVKGSDVKAAFPDSEAVKITSAETIEAYTKFYDQNYYSNKVVFDQVEPGETYLYRVGNAAGWSPVYRLCTTQVGNGYEVLFLSDPQIGTGTVPTDRMGWDSTLNKAFELYPGISFIANTGDFVDVATKENEYDAYFTPELLRSYPTATAVGNHDIAVNYSYHFNEPNASALGASAANSDYYFTYGNVLYMVLNTSNINHSEHVQFMEETIAATADQEFDWKVVMFHQSIYASGKQSRNEDVPMRREIFVPAFDELGIDVVLMGHDHCYARTHQMKGFEPVSDVQYDAAGAALSPEGTVYITTSSASGSKYYNLEEDYEYLAYREQSYVPVFTHLVFTADTFTMTAHRTDTMEVFDTYTIRK